MTYADPIADAAREMDARYAQTAAFNAALERVTLDIQMAFTAYFAGDAMQRVEYVKTVDSRHAVVVVQLVVDAIDDHIDRPGCRDAFAALLMGKGTVEELREKIVASYLESWGEELAMVWSGQ